MKKYVLLLLFQLSVFSFLLSVSPGSNSVFAYDASCNEPGETCCSGMYGSKECAPTLECNMATNKCQAKTCGNEGIQCCDGLYGSKTCNTPDLECNASTICQAKTCGNEGIQCCDGLYGSKTCNTPDLECNASTICQAKTCGNEGIQCCDGFYGSKTCNTPDLECNASDICVPNLPIPTIPVYNPECGFDNSEIPEGEGTAKGIKTALGCLSTDPEVFVNTAMPWAVGIGAGIAFLLGVFGAAMITLSAGNPEKMQAGKEMITSAIGGLILIMFAVFILKIIGVDILKLF